MIEVCADSVSSAIAAQEGGADRIELCSGLVIGGLSPSPALFRQVRECVDLEIRVLLRPRFGDFCYDDYEFRMIREEVEMFKELGADGVVIGMLKPDGELDTAKMEALVRTAGDMKITMHRAFDVCRDPYEAMEQCISMGIGTILTSGQRSSAWEGRELLGSLAERADGRVEILAGAGINPEVIRKLKVCTQLKSFHLSGKKTVDSRMNYRKKGVPMGLPGFNKFEIWQTDSETIREAVLSAEE